MLQEKYSASLNIIFAINSVNQKLFTSSQVCTSRQSTIYLAQSDGLSACFADNFCIAFTSCFVRRVIGLYGQSCPTNPDVKFIDGFGVDRTDCGTG